MKALQTLSLVSFLTFASGALAAEPATELLSEAQTAYLRGEIDSAKAKFESVIKLDPKNQVAIGYLRQIRAKEAEKGAGGSQEKQLAKLIVPTVQFKDATLTSALEFLKQQVPKLTDGKQAVNFVVQVPEAQANTAITLNLTSIPFTEVLKYIGSLANVSFVYDKYAIMVKSVGGTAKVEPRVEETPK
ncbi:MAG: hypothetical protein QOE70_6563 [Chthoniobacter sp.]|nr:hypothetical protein [Chthoniobacter sp.]